MPLGKRIWIGCVGRCGPARQAAVAGGGGSHLIGPGGRIEYGGHSYSHWEDDAVVMTTHLYHAGHELVIEERMRLVNDGARLRYSHSVTGPDATNDIREITFAALG